MAVPKEKISKARRRSRVAANFKAPKVQLAECPKCHELKLSHKVCKKCGYYKGEQIINMEEKKDKPQA